MGMHEFENVVEGSILLLADSEKTNDLDLRSIFYALYQYQKMFDTGFTNFRVMDILLKYKYSYKFSVSQHPDYNKYQEFFDVLSDFEFIQVKPTEPWDRENNPTAGYFKDGVLYCDAGSPLWKRFIEEGTLTGNDAQPPASMKMADIVACIMELAETKGNIALIRMWYPLFILDCDDLWKDESLEALKSDPSVQAIRQITRRTKALEIEMSYGYLGLPTAEEVQDSLVLSWWFHSDE